MEVRTIWTDGRGRWKAILAAVATTTVLVAPARAQNAARLAEVPAGNVLTDALREISGAALALAPASALRADGDLQKMPPAAVVGILSTGNDSVVVMDLSGKQILDALERSFAFPGKPFAGFLQVSGLQVRYAPAKPSGQRVVAALVDGKPVDPARRYRVAMPRPLADGQLGYFQIWNKDQIAQDTGKSLDDALKLLAARRPEGSGVEGRIVADGAPKKAAP